MKIINSFAPELVAARKQAKLLCHKLNQLSADQHKERKPLYQALFGKVTSAYIEPHFYCDYGYNIYLGEKFYANHDCIILDAAEIHIGHRVLLGPKVQLYSTSHPLDPDERARGLQNCAPITVSDDVWIGGGAIVLPGVTIGAATVVGAGSVVTRSIPAGVVAAGNPCRVLRTATPSDLVHLE